MQRSPEVPDDAHGLETIDLVTGIIDDTRELVEVHVEALREDLSARLTTLGATLTSALIAVAAFVVTALLLGLATAATLTAIGAPWWLALWIVSLGAGALGVWFGLRARTKAHQMTKEKP